MSKWKQESKAGRRTSGVEGFIGQSNLWCLGFVESQAQAKDVGGLLTRVEPWTMVGVGAVPTDGVSSTGDS